MNNGLYARDGASATATAAAWANRFDAPMTKVSNVYFSFSFVFDVWGWAGAVYGCPAVGWPVNVGQISCTAARASPSSSTSSSESSSASSRDCPADRRESVVPFDPPDCGAPDFAVPDFAVPDFEAAVEASPLVDVPCVPVDA